MLHTISPYSVSGNQGYVNPQAKVDLTAAAPQVKQDAQKSVQASKTDTVTISKQALQKLAGEGGSPSRQLAGNAGGKTGGGLHVTA